MGTLVCSCKWSLIHFNLFCQVDNILAPIHVPAAFDKGNSITVYLSRQYKGHVV